MPDRLQMLRQMVATRESDPFPRYGLAMELRKRGDIEAARTTFEFLLREHAEYLPSYLMAGNLLAESGDRAGARAVYERGMSMAAAAGDEHTRSELEAAHAELD